MGQRVWQRDALWVAQAAVIAGLYAALTLAGYGYSFREMQFRVAEVLTLLPVFTSAAIPGLTVGCLVANLVSPLGPLDMLFGPVATLLAALCTWLLRQKLLKGLPVLSALMPVLFNAVIVGAVITLTADGGVSFADFDLLVFFSAAGSVGGSELVICLALGMPLCVLLRKTRLFERLEVRRR
ncbi:MAG: QueT transporter family protein [Oscillospiraceae bacterium]|nr:QueT transporter family protein [Oscillospiraceae bacterium]